MSNVYSFDDKILHIESLHLKRTNEILDSRDEAVEALLNYCGDDTMDGMPLLARYWADDQHTEIKHVRGYIHNVNGSMGISIDDICDVDRDEIIEIIEEMLSAVTASTVYLGHFDNWQEAHNAMTAYTSDEVVEGTGLIATYENVGEPDGPYHVMYGTTLSNGQGGVNGTRINPSNVDYWECVDDATASTESHRKYPFHARNGAYTGAEVELIENEGERMEKHGDPMVYVTPVHDDRLRYGNTWYGRHTWPWGPSEARPDYDMLTVFSSHIDENTGDEVVTKTILDAKKYERLIHQGIYLAGRAQSKNDNYVIKKPVPVFSKPYYAYFFEGRGISIEIPPITPNGSVTIKLPRAFYPYDYDYAGFEGMLERTRRGSGLIGMLHDNQLGVTFNVGQEENTLMIINQSMGRTFWASITLECRVNIDEPGNDNNRRKGVAVFPCGYPDYALISDGAFTDEGHVKKCYSREELSADTYEIDDQEYPLLNRFIDFTKRLYVKDYSMHTFDTTSPGFRVENGKIRCYRRTDLKKELPQFWGDSYDDTWSTAPRRQPRYVKDGTVFYFNHEHGFNNGIKPKIITFQSDVLKAYIGGLEIDPLSELGRARFWKNEGRFEYLGRVRRGRNNRFGGHGSNEPGACYFYARYVGVESNGLDYVFNFEKTESNGSVYIEKVGVEFVGTDGLVHRGYFQSLHDGTPGTAYSFPPEAGEYTAATRNFFVFDESSKNYCHYIGYNSFFGFSGNMRVIYVKFAYNSDDEKAMKFVSLDYGQDSLNDTASTISEVVSIGRSSTSYGRTRWQLIAFPRDTSGRNRLSRNFRRSYFNRCRFFRKYKGVISEFPEYFYTR